VIRSRHIEYSPRISKREIVNNDRTLNAADALAIAEKAGGAKARIEINNICNIYLFYKIKKDIESPNLYWTVRYVSEDSLHFAEIMVDAYTGETESIILEK
jgi:hypothetical protein